MRQSGREDRGTVGGNELGDRQRRLSPENGLIILLYTMKLHMQTYETQQRAPSEKRRVIGCCWGWGWGAELRVKRALTTKPVNPVIRLAHGG